MFIKDDVKRALLEEADAERICALSQAVRALAAACDSADYDDAVRRELGIGS